MSADEWILALLPNALLIGYCIYSEVSWVPPGERWAREARKRIARTMPRARLLKRSKP